jgi:16S rRNA (guanine966-N2)-methyltransferase
VRIVAGSAKGVRLASVPAGVRPLSDRAREGLFSSLGAEVPGARVLDLYAGTGATGLEALSRGALLAVFVDRSHAALAAVHENLERAKVADRATVVPAHVLSFLARTEAPADPFDLVFVDPPYEIEGPDLDDVMGELAARWLPEEGWTVVLTRGRKSSTPVIPLHWSAARELRYGDSLLTLYRPNDRPRNLGV